MFLQSGCGLGLRSQHYPVIIETWPEVDWFEAISENYMDTGGRPIHVLEKIRARYPIALHGTALSIGSTDPLNQDYLKRLKALVERINPFVVSDHLCWSGIDGYALHDLLPLPFTPEAVEYVVSRVQKVQEFLKRQILLENVSSYVTYRHSEIPEWEFLAEVAKRSGCGVLLDVNNVYVNSVNHKFDPRDYLKNIPGELIGQIHLAGHTDMGTYLFDTHSTPVVGPVWELYREALKHFGPISTLIEWDEHIPPFERLFEEAMKARAIYQQFGTRKLSASSGNQFVSKGCGSVSLSAVEREIKSNILRGSKIDESIFSSPHLSERMAVYQNGYPARIRESLKEVYEAVQSVLGGERFDLLACDYAYQFPSRDYNLNFAGVHLPEFLERHEYSGTFPFLPDLAKLEWLIWKAFHAFDKPALNPETLKNISADDWETMKLVFQPSANLLFSDYSVFDIWQARRNLSAKIDVSKPQKVLIGRKQDQVRCELLNDAQFQLLEGLLAGKSLGEVCEALADSDGEIPIADWFSRWVQDGLIVNCQRPKPDSAVPK